MARFPKPRQRPDKGRLFPFKKPGTLSRQLGIPVEKNIPVKFLQEIIRTPIGGTAVNPTKTGKRRIMVTLLLKRRAVAARNAQRIARGQTEKVTDVVRPILGAQVGMIGVGTLSRVASRT